MTVQNHKENPFPGLRPFSSDESHLFFGRDGQSDELLERLGKNRFLAVVGTSGSGKSSLVRAGLLPTIHGGFMTDAGSHWRVAIFRPGDNPTRNLAEALSQPGVLKDKRSSKEDHNIFSQYVDTEIALRRGSLGLVEIFRQSRLPKEENLLIVVDQFEELFRFKGSSSRKDEAAAFVKLLLRAVEQENAPIYIVITMRSEFLGDSAQFRDLPEAINNSQYLIPRMTRHEIREAIEGPVAVGGAEISPPLISRLLNDVGDNPDQLPILQHALMRTWDYWSKNHSDNESLGIEHYEAIGTMKNALSRHAEEAYAELKTETRLAICEKMFKLLTDSGETGYGVRRLTKVSEICSVTGASEDEVIEVINAFRKTGRTFLMPPIEEELKPDSVVDISHESLMRNWTRLKRWVKEESNSADIYCRLATDTALYEKGDRGLMGDPELSMVLKWRDEKKPNADWAKRYNPQFVQAMDFLEASKKHREHVKEEKEKQREREIKDREKIRELEIKRREEQIRIKRTRIFAAIITIIGVIAILFAVWALHNKSIAEEQKVIAEKRRDEALKSREEAQIQKKIAQKQRNEAIKQEKIAGYLKDIAFKEKDAATVAQMNAELKRKIAEYEKVSAEVEGIKKTIQKLTTDMKEAESSFNHYLAKAKELAGNSITETNRKELKVLLALTAYDLNDKAYDNLKKVTNEKFKEFKELKENNNLDIVPEADDLVNKYKMLQKKAESRHQPTEIFEALRKAYIDNESSQDILSSAESRALAVVGNDRIVFNNRNGELLLSLLQAKTNDLKLPGIKKLIPLSKDTIFRANSFTQSKDRLFCGTREGIVLYWEKSNGICNI